MQTQIGLCATTILLVVLQVNLTSSHAAEQAINIPQAVSISTVREQFKAGNHTVAEELANQLLEHAKAQGSLIGEFDALNLILAIRYGSNRYSEQLLAYEYRQENIAQELGDEQMLATVLNNLGYDLLTTGSAPIKEIIPRLERANDIYAKSEGHHGRWYTLMNLTWAYRKAGEFEKSLSAGEKALSQAQAIEDRHAIIETSLNLAETHLANRNIKQADALVALAKREAETQTDRDRHVYEVYAAQHSLETLKPVANLSKLINAVGALKSQEIFYEMLGRSVLAKHYLQKGNKSAAETEADKVLAAENDYVPREALARAAEVKAHLE